MKFTTIVPLLLSSVFVLASADSKAGKVAKLANKAKFPKVAKSGYGYGMCMSTSSMSMSVGPEPPITPSPTPTPTTLQPTPEPSLAPSSSSEPSPAPTTPITVTGCGEIFTNQKVVLADDLDCGGPLVGDPQDQEDCAVTLDGPEAEIDCQGNTLSQVATPQANYADGPFVQGICLNDGATATNCNVEQFVSGIRVTDGDGEVRSSFLTSNNIGIYAVFTEDGTLTIEDT